jgi:hypothetical protein
MKYVNQAMGTEKEQLEEYRGKQSSKIGFSQNITHDAARLQ